MATSSGQLARLGCALALLGGIAFTAQAQNLDSLKGMAGGLTGGGGTGSLASGSMGNAAGVIEFCMKNNFLGGTDASSVKDGLMSKIPGGKPARTRATPMAPRACSRAAMAASWTFRAA